MTRRLLWLLVCCVVVPASAWAQPDVTGATDHPIVPRLAGGQYYISDYEAHDLGTGDFYIADGSRTVEGRFTRIEYWIKDAGKAYSGVEIGRNYQRAVTEKQGETLHFDLSNSGGNATFRLVVAKRLVWIGLSVSNDGDVYELTIVEETVTQPLVALHAGAMAAALVADGRVTVQGILFDTGQATITTESMPQLEALAELLAFDDSLHLEIVGHTDATGAPADNQTLSRQRAEAIKTWLVTTKQVAAARLTTAGRVDSHPVGVELIKRS